MTLTDVCNHFTVCELLQPTLMCSAIRSNLHHRDIVSLIWLLLSELAVKIKTKGLFSHDRHISLLLWQTHDPFSLTDTWLCLPWQTLGSSYSDRHTALLVWHTTPGPFCPDRHMAPFILTSTWLLLFWLMVPFSLTPFCWEMTDTWPLFSARHMAILVLLWHTWLIFPETWQTHGPFTLTRGSFFLRDDIHMAHFPWEMTHGPFSLRDDRQVAPFFLTDTLALLSDNHLVPFTSWPLYSRWL